MVAGRFLAAATLSRRALPGAALSGLAVLSGLVLLSGCTALSLPAAFARPAIESARTESAPGTRASSGAATVATGVTDVAPRRAPRHPPNIASSETVPSRVIARMRERGGVTCYLVGILTGARPLQLRRQRNFVSCGSDSKPRPVKVRDGSFSTNVLSVKIWLRT